MNHSNSKIIAWLKQEWPDAMQYMQQLGDGKEERSCPPCTTGKATRAPFNQESQIRYALLEALSSGTKGPISPSYSDGNKFIQLLVDACTGWTDAKLMRAKRGAGKAITHSLAKIQMLCNAKSKRLQTDGAKEQDKK